MTRPDIGNAYRELGHAWAEVRDLPRRRDRWKAYAIVTAAAIIVPVVALVMVIRGED